jgi:hypothetical protein
MLTTPLKRAMHYAAQGHQIPPPHMPTQSAPYAQPYPSANERLQRPAAAYPMGPPHGRQDSPSPSEESHHQANDDSDSLIGHELAHTQHKAPSHIRESREVAATRTNGAWSNRHQDDSSEEGSLYQPSKGSLKGCDN